MNDVPYEFIDRVFTKLTIQDVQTIAVEAPVWKEVKRVYEEKHLSLHVNLYLPNADHEFTYEICKENDQDVQFTLDEALKLDSRFYRVNHFHICETDSDELWTDLDVERIPDLLDYASRFNLTTLVLHDSSESPSDFETKLAAREFRTKTLNMDYVLGAEFLKKQLQSRELQTLFAYNFAHCSAELMDDLEAFVCRPNFLRLHCDFQCFEMENFKRIVAYWKTAETVNKWKIWMETNRNLYDDFASWMTPCVDRPQFCEQFGNFTLTIVCDDGQCELTCEENVQ